MAYDDRCKLGRDDTVCIRPRGHHGECDLKPTISTFESRVEHVRQRLRAADEAHRARSAVRIPRWLFWLLVLNAIATLLNAVLVLQGA